MDYETKIYFERLTDAINNPDWWMFGVTVVSVFISGVLSVLLFILTRRLGQEQNAIQQNNLRIQMHREYFDIYDALLSDLGQFSIEYNQLKNALEITHRSIEPSRVRKIIARAQQLLPFDDFECLRTFEYSYSQIQQNAYKIYGYAQSCDEDTTVELNEKLQSCGVDSFLETLYKKTNYEDVNDFLQNVEEIFSLLSNDFTEKIRKYSDLSDILR